LKYVRQWLVTLPNKIVYRHDSESDELRHYLFSTGIGEKTYYPSAVGIGVSGAATTLK